jgi:acetolactate decarboxylase
VLFFDADRELPVWEGLNATDLPRYLDESIAEDNIFHAVMLEGTFSYVKTRSVPGQQKPYPPLVEVTAHQPTFEFQNVRGTIVGFYSPAYVEGLNVPGYHLHFVTEDRTGGGHVLEFTIKDAELFVDYSSELHLILPNTDEFNRLDLTRSRQGELEEAEK